MIEKYGYLGLGGAFVWAALTTIGATTHAEELVPSSPDYFTLGSVEVTEIPESQETARAQSAGVVPSEFQASHIGALKAAGGGVVGSIVNIGLQVWKVVQDGAPVVSVESPGANAIPAGAKWDDLSGWDEPKSAAYHVVYKNLLGVHVVDLSYRITYVVGGSYHGSGKYIANVSTVVDNLNVAWGYHFDANAEVPSVENIGSPTDPIASMQMLLHWTVKSTLVANYITREYSVSGAGNFRDISPDANPSLP